MPKRTLPGGVTAYDTVQEAIDADAIDPRTLKQQPDGSLVAAPKQNGLINAAPYIIIGAMGAGLASAATAPAALSSAGLDFTGATGLIEGAGAAGLPPLGAAAGSWLAPALKYGLPVATNLAGNVIQSKANSSAAKIQAALTEEALKDARDQRDIENRHYDETIARQQEVQGYNRQQYADFSKSLEPYRQAGLSASDRMAMLLKQRYS